MAQIEVRLQNRAKFLQTCPRTVAETEKTFSTPDSVNGFNRFVANNRCIVPAKSHRIIHCCTGDTNALLFRFCFVFYHPATWSAAVVEIAAHISASYAPSRFSTNWYATARISVSDTAMYVQRCSDLHVLVPRRRSERSFEIASSDRNRSAAAGRYHSRF